MGIQDSPAGGTPVDTPEADIDLDKLGVDRLGADTPEADIDPGKVVQVPVTVGKQLCRIIRLSYWKMGATGSAIVPASLGKMLIQLCHLGCPAVHPS